MSPGGGGAGGGHWGRGARHGLAAWRSRQNSVDMTKLIRKMRSEPPSKNAEIETQSLSVWRLRAYSNTRRGMPSRPSANSGMKGELRKMKIVHKWGVPSFSFTVNPFIFVSQ